MPVQETLDAVGELRALELPIGAVVVNQTRRPALRGTDLQAARRGELDRTEIEKGLASAGLDGHSGLVDALEREAASHAERVQLERAQRRRLSAVDLPIVTLPWLADGVDLAGLYQLADELGHAKGEPPW
jgi:hypothetical protein